MAEPVTPKPAPPQPLPADELLWKLVAFVVLVIVFGIVGGILDSLR